LFISVMGQMFCGVADNAMSRLASNPVPETPDIHSKQRPQPLDNHHHNVSSSGATQAIRLSNLYAHLSLPIFLDTRSGIPPIDDADSYLPVMGWPQGTSNTTNLRNTPKMASSIWPRKCTFYQDLICERWPISQTTYSYVDVPQRKSPGPLLGLKLATGL
jgi:hypothetical protein